jgi:hypothetical protein
MMPRERERDRESSGSGGSITVETMTASDGGCTRS